ncbi:extracellular solute-binding protein [Pseudonocardia lacus]|jgi:raffinose/stachyose/melibiose transport system substrate-binding protein|uniref:extracellular solute-binding protein n=1 Tax=Pseudonocardia lacus TaxID=2835865 RepID=UPI001BDD6154|nr:extracellular solute-binding protein [Pseudonocardia lacus]
MALAAPLGMSALASCGTAGPGQARAGEASIWYLSTQPQEGIRQAGVEAFNAANPDGKLALTFFQNDAYKAKIKTAIGADQAPTMIWTWGGGGLREYVRNGQVDDLTDWFAENPAVKDKRFAPSFGAATIDGRIYAVPCENVSPIVFYYNKDLFAQVGAQPPTTWNELMALVPVFNNAGIAPMSLGGQSRWTSMMWLEYLLDRIGGSEVFETIAGGEKDGWSHPAVTEALTKIQDFIRAGGFVNGFQSVTADSNADQALLYTGKAAMMLHGSWTYGGMKEDGGDFVPGGHLGFTTFPEVEGGVGDPAFAVGNPASYLALNSSATEEEKTIAKNYFANGLLTDADADNWITKAGSVPIVNGADAKFAGAADEEFLQFVYDLSSNAPVFAQSWDQALPPATADVLLTNIEQLFGLTITPEQWVANMNATQTS